MVSLSGCRQSSSASGSQNKITTVKKSVSKTQVSSNIIANTNVAVLQLNNATTALTNQLASSSVDVSSLALLSSAVAGVRYDLEEKSIDSKSATLKDAVGNSSIALKQLLNSYSPYGVHSKLSTSCIEILGYLNYLKDTYNFDIGDLPADLELHNSLSLGDIVWDATKGNSLENLANGGLITQVDNSLYFKGWNNKLCTANVDGSNAKYTYIDEDYENTESKLAGINIINGTLFYDSYSIPTNVGDINYLQSTSPNKRLSTRIDSVLWNKWGYSSDELYICDHINYVTCYSLSNLSVVKSFSLKDKNNINLPSDDSINFLGGDENYIYYQVDNDLLCASLDGSNVRVILQGGSNIHFSGDYIYYNYNSILHRLNLKTGIVEDVMPAVSIYNVNGDYIYYADSAATSIYRYKLDSLFEPQKLNNQVFLNPVGSIALLPSGLYFYDNSNNNFCGRIEADGSLIDLTKWTYTENEGHTFGNYTF